MSPVVDLGFKAISPSSWSIDSGYETCYSLQDSLSSIAQKQKATGLGIAGICTGLSDHEVLTSDPVTTKLNVFTTSSSTTSGFVTPSVPTLNTASCPECAFWQTLTPGKSTKCQKCQSKSSLEPPNAWPLSDPSILPRLNTGASTITTSDPFRNATPIARCAICDVFILPGSNYCSSCSADKNSSPVSPLSTPKRSRAGRNSKLPVHALNRLQAWLDAHQDHPYPTAETKKALARECGITEKQVNTWFTNARARQLNPAGSGSDSDAVDDSDEGISPQLSAGAFAYSHPSAPSEHRRASAASSARARTSRRGKKKDYRRNANQDVPQTPVVPSPIAFASPADQGIPADLDMWQCTFCRKALVPKSWRRHEDTQHRPKTQAARWTCMLHGPRLINRSPTSTLCAFCMMKNPPEDHFLNHHRIQDCANRDIRDRTFYRPDHLRQHIKNFHSATLYDIVQARWKTAAETVAEGWTCGFCGDRLETWDKRETHIANHFKDGMTMASWRDYPEMEKRPSKKRSHLEMEQEGETTTSITTTTATASTPFRRPQIPTLVLQNQDPVSPYTNVPHHPQHLPMAPPPPQHQQQPSPQQLQNHTAFHIAPAAATVPQHHYSPIHAVSPQQQVQAQIPYVTSTTAPLNVDLNITQAPIHPIPTALDPLAVDAYSRYFDWAAAPAALEEHHHQHQHQHQQMLQHGESLGAGVGVSTGVGTGTVDALQQGFGGAGMSGIHLYGDPGDYLKGWGFGEAQNDDQGGEER